MQCILDLLIFMFLSELICMNHNYFFIVKERFELLPALCSWQAFLFLLALVTAMHHLWDPDWSLAATVTPGLCENGTAWLGDASTICKRLPLWIGCFQRWHNKGGLWDETITLLCHLIQMKSDQKIKNKMLGNTQISSACRSDWLCGHLDLYYCSF